MIYLDLNFVKQASVSSRTFILHHLKYKFKEIRLYFDMNFVKQTYSVSDEITTKCKIQWLLIPSAFLEWEQFKITSFHWKHCHRKMALVLLWQKTFSAVNCVSSQGLWSHDSKWCVLIFKLVTGSQVRWGQNGQ